ncbi:NADH-FMN oxidoreductase RutF, flavin reductase (DIM6/NTAB) family [Paenibacillus sp. CF095]|uniref:flavin reductase family protein n=1 Tax=Paenibacillus TaxID=44249 RepID=UPI000880D69D|nr:flavin reductase family protein [Paenibacillus sp. CF095]SDD28822.1 NADH-FMN oxidoreductase RutF, flavin reductase (DIM6/NTAB) family [Paenibacillus sp. CF095]
MARNNVFEFAADDITIDEMYKLMIGSVVPRPIAWVSTRSKDGALNLAPFSFFTVASRNPPTLLISVGPGVGERQGTVKDTLLNIRETGEFVINVVPAVLAASMQRSSADVASDEDEFELAGVTPKAGIRVDVPSVLESPIAFELTLDRIIAVGTDHLVLGKVEHVRVDAEAYAGHYKIAIESWQPLASLAGDYALMKPAFSV